MKLCRIFCLKYLCMTVPQFILDWEMNEGRGSRTSIIITQPRRVSALGVASRVSSERAEDGSVGYAIRGERKATVKTKLLFCTTGVVLRRLGAGDKLNGVSHIIVDEVRPGFMGVATTLTYTFAGFDRFMNVLSTETSSFWSSRSSSRRTIISRSF